MFKHSRAQAHNLGKAIPWPVYMVWAAIAAMVIIGLVASIAEAHTTRPTDRVCFDAQEWGPAPDAVRPCVRLVGNSPEGGALRFTVSDASGVVRYAGYVNTTYRQIIHVRVVRLYEDGSFTWKARSRDGRTVLASVGNLED